jgi:hypothetical protein
VSVTSSGRLPPPDTLLRIYDEEARRTMTAAQREVEPIVARETPHRSGILAAGLRPRVTRTSTGSALLIAAPRGKPHDVHATLAEVLRYVSHGTGQRREGAGPKKKIRAKRAGRRMILPGGHARWSVRGQWPNHFMDRIRLVGTPRVEAAAEDGANVAARTLERTVSGG